MPGTEEKLKDGIERSALLTAYVTGRCTHEEALAIKKAADGDAVLARDIDFLRTIRARVQSEAITSPGEFGWHRLKRSLVAPESRTLGIWARAAVMAGVMVLAVEGGLQWSRNAQYRPLGDDPGEAALQVQFRPEVLQSEIHALLQSAKVEIVSGPGSAGIYRLRPVSGGDDALAAALAALKARPDIVSHVAEEP